MWLGSYQTSITGVAVFKETKYCEQCGRITIRVVGSTDKYCKSCHANWDFVIPELERFMPEVEKAPRRSCRKVKPKQSVTPVVPEKRKRAKTRQEIIDAIWGR